MSLTKEVAFGGTDQFFRAAVSMPVRITSNDAGRSACQLAANQARRASQFVGDGLDSGVKRVAVSIAASAIVDERAHAGNADRDFRQAFAPGTAETVADDDGEVDAELLFNLAAETDGG